MANEITVTGKISCTNGNFSETRNVSSLRRDQAAIGSASGVQVIGTSEETVTVGDVGTLGYAYFRNLDATNYVDIGPDSTGIVGFIRLEPGDFCILRLKPGITIKAQADTASVKLDKVIFED